MTLLVLLVGTSIGAGEAPPHQTATGVDCYGDPLPARAIARLGTVRFRHVDSEYISALAFSPDGKILASAGGTRDWLALVGQQPYWVRLWDVATGRELRRLASHAIAMDCIAFSPDGKLLATADREQGIRIWQLRTGKLIATLHCKPTVITIAFSGDSKHLVTFREEKDEADAKFQILDVVTGKPVCAMTAPSWWAHSMDVAPDGKTLALAEANDVTIRDASTGKVLHRLNAPKPAVLAFSLDGRTLVCTNGWSKASIWIWDVANCTLRGRIAAPKPYTLICRIATPDVYLKITTLALTPDGRTLLIGDAHGQTKLWDIVEGKLCPRAWPCKSYRFKFSPDGKTIATVSEGSLIRLWDWASGQERMPFAAHRDVVESLVFSSDGRTLISGGRDGSIRMWDPMSGRQRRIFRQLGAAIDCLTISADGRRLAAGGEDRMVYVWDLATDKEQWRLIGHHGPVDSVDFSPDGTRLLSGSKDGTVRLWDITHGRMLRTIAALSKDKRPVSKGPTADDDDDGDGPLDNEGTGGAFAPDGQSMAIADGSYTVRVFDGQTSGVRAALKTSRWQVSRVRFTPDARTVVAYGASGTIYAWDIRTHQAVTLAAARSILDEPEGSALISPDGRLLATGMRTLPARCWELASGAEVCAFNSGLQAANIDAGAMPIAFSPNGRLLASAGDSTYSILIWDMTGMQGPNRPAPPYTANQWSGLWERLTGPADDAHRALWRLVYADGAVSHIRRWLQPIPQPDPKRITAWLADLDDRRFAVRATAMRELAGLQDTAEPYIRKHLTTGVSPEVQHRLRLLVDAAQPHSRQSLGQTRAIAVLEYIGNAQARALLEKIGQGAPNGRLTREAKQALRRLGK